MVLLLILFNQIMSMDFLFILENSPTYESKLPFITIVLVTLISLIAGLFRLNKVLPILDNKIAPGSFGIVARAGFLYRQITRRFVKDTFSFVQNQLFKEKNKRRPLPPGPAPWPIVGNLPEIWRNKPTFKWIHGLMKELNTNICCIRLGNVHVIPVTSPEIAREVLKDNDSVFASRPLTMGTEYLSGGFLSTAVVPWGQQWKKMRKVVASHVLNSARLHSLLIKRREEADNLVSFVYNQCFSNNVDSVINVRLAARQYCGNVIRKMMFSRRYFVEGKDNGRQGLDEEEHVESLFIVLNHIYSFILSDYVPWMRVLDLEGHEKIISDAMRTISKYHDPIINERVQQWRCGKKKAAEDLLDAFISAKDEKGQPLLSVPEIKAQCTELMVATVDNPSNAVEWAIAEMINQPDILKRATDEIDRVVGKGRLVQEADIPHLNYVKACLREAFRIHPVAPFNVPHVSTCDATISGYFIPKGSHILLSRQGLGRNPEVWEDPLKFKPERHINLADHLHPVELAEPELKFISFSRGRRGCMGVALGSEMSVMLLARLLHGFDWSAPSNEKKIDLAESKFDLFMAKPLHARAMPRLPAELYSA